MINLARTSRLMARALAGVGLLACLVVFRTEVASSQSAASNTAREAPIFEVVPGWLKLPNNWVFGVVSAVSVDRHDNVWILNRPRDVPEAQRANAAPSVLEFDSNGKFLQAWGYPTTKELWPRREHAMYVDANDNVWVGGSWREKGESDDYIQKFDSKGKLLLQIGRPNEAKSPRDTANIHGATDLFMYPKTNEIFVADEGYVRLMVFDAGNGKFKRMWAGSGDPPAEREPDVPAEGRGRGQRQQPQPGQLPRAWAALHTVQVSNDGMVYAADRNNRRIQVFTLDGKFLKEVDDVYASGMTLSRDPGQRFLYLADSSGSGVEQIVVLDRQSLTIVSRFGKEGTAPGEFRGPHGMAVDSKNTLYVTEVAPGNRLQKFVFKGLSAAAK